MRAEKEEQHCDRCGRSERETTLTQHFDAGEDACGLIDYFLCPACEREEEEG